jgi:hypothetical protein
MTESGDRVSKIHALAEEHENEYLEKLKTS